jgi:hypothetical protein
VHTERGAEALYQFFSPATAVEATGSDIANITPAIPASLLFHAL